MKKYYRSLSIVLTIGIILNTFIGLANAGSVTAGSRMYQDPLGLLPSWALDGGAPADPLAGLLPADPLSGLLPNLPAPSTPGLPKSGANTQDQPGLKAPAEVSIPTPPPAPDCQCAPGTVNVATGAISLSITDLSLAGIGLPINLTRRYSSTDVATDGPFGPGWSLDLGARLQMYVHFNLTEHRGDDSRTTFTFHDGTGGAFVDSFDGDSHSHQSVSGHLHRRRRTGLHH